ncbi:acetolactate synthase [Yangia mangrovi]|uniref:Acetolactate synthase n=1 Tax=Alloyangia mangrovi TaxID=1779329 RepID=A0A2A3JVZ5_9RHOB|nr:DUF6497 family protein [Alloyangia mangrovi]MCT4371201.1 acetolactate synthase [Alloyangia mangrovi]
MTPGLATAQEESVVAVPSGMPVTFYDALWDDSAAVERFRFLAPEIGGFAPRGFDEVSADMQHLCDSFALSRLGEVEVIPSLIVISLMAEPVAYGESRPEIRQYFEAYSPRNGACVWEAF